MAPVELPSPHDSFLARWANAAASERANAQLFLTELADLLGVPRPGNDHATGYSFEFPVKIPTGPGLSTDGRIDLYRRGCFVLEAKQFVAAKAEPTDLALALGAEEKKKSGPIREHLKRLEGEVLDTAAGFGENLLLDLATHSVDPHQFLGIELNPRAASLAELILWRSATSSGISAPAARPCPPSPC